MAVPGSSVKDIPERVPWVGGGYILLPPLSAWGRLGAPGEMRAQTTGDRVWVLSLCSLLAVSLSISEVSSKHKPSFFFLPEAPNS